MSRIYLNNLTQVKKVGDTLYIAKNNVQDSSSSELVTALPLGYIFTYPFSVPPDGCIIANGAEYSRELYADLWAYYSSKTECTKTEEEWQSIASANNGYCPYFSSGDGSTTFRVPKFAPYQQLAISAANATTYHQAGLPSGKVVSSTSVNGQGIVLGPGSKLQAANSPYGVVASTGGFSSTAPVGLSIENNTALASKGSPSDFIVDFNNIAESTTVQPESHEWIVCIVAFGKATNVGEVDVANVMSAVANVQAALPNKIDTTVPHIVEQWKEDSSDGTSAGGWYRLWSNGWLEQGNSSINNSRLTVNKTITFYKEFRDTTYYLGGVGIYIDTLGEQLISSRSTNGFTTVSTVHNSGTYYWYACGYAK